MSNSNDSTRKAMAGLGGLVRGVGREVVGGVGRDVVTGVGRDIGSLVRREFESARAELLTSAKRAGRGAGLLGGAAVAGELSLLFLSLAVWEGLGKRLGPGRAALLLGTLAGGAGVALASRGAEELQRIQGAPRTVQSLRDLGNAAADAATDREPDPASAPRTTPSRAGTAPTASTSQTPTVTPASTTDPTTGPIVAP